MLPRLTCAVVRTARTAPSHSIDLARRSFAAATIKPTEEKPDYYRILNIRRDATPEQVKQAFREQAKLYHPDLRRGGTDADLNAFKAVNEAYSVLGDPSARRDYDHERFSRAATLKARNEGIYGTELPVDAPKSIYEAQGWETMRGSPATGTGTGTGRAASSNAAVGSAASFSSYSTEDNEEAFRRSMARATEKQRDSAKFRASFARMSRQKIEIPSRERTLMRLAAPLGVVVLWAFNWYFFMR